MTRVPHATPARQKPSANAAELALPQGDPGAPVAEGYIARLPVLDRARGLVGFELFYRSPDGAPVERMEAAQRTAALLGDLFTAVGFDEALGGLQGFVSADAVFLDSALVELLPPARVVMGLGESVSTSRETLVRLADLRRRGYRFALDHYWGERERIASLSPLVDYVKIDLDWIDPAALAGVMRPLQAARVRVVATQVESAEQFQLALAHGCELFQGYHFAQPETVRGRRTPADSAGLMRLLTIANAGCDPGKLEEEFKRQPAMSVSLLKLVNSVGLRASSPVRSLREAIFRIGQRPLTVWLQLMLYTAGTAGVGNVLLHTAALRGKLMELLAGEIEPGRPEFGEAALMVGILSLMHVVFGQPQAAFAATLGVDEAIRQALVSRGGRLGALLSIVERRESGAQGGALPVEGRTFGRFEAEALRWASGLSQSAR